MDIYEKDVGSDEKDVEFRLTLFSNIKKSFKAIRETVSDKVSEEWEKGLVTEIAEVSENPSADDPEDDDVPLIQRYQQMKKNNSAALCTHTRQTRSTRRINEKKQEETKDSVVADVVEIDSDSEITLVGEVSSGNISLNTTMCLNSSIEDITEDDENKLISVKINWMDGKMHRFRLQKCQNFNTIFDELAEKENVPKEKILLILRDEIFIKRNDTPDSLKLSIIDIIEGGITKQVYENAQDDVVKMDKNMLQFKCVLKDKKKPLLICIKKNDPMHCLMVKAADQLNCSLEQLKFMFEGDELERNITPVDLDLEGGEIIDVVCKQ